MYLRSRRCDELECPQITYVLIDYRRWRERHVIAERGPYEGRSGSRSGLPARHRSGDALRAAWRGGFLGWSRQSHCCMARLVRRGARHGGQVIEARGARHEAHGSLHGHPSALFKLVSFGDFNKNELRPKRGAVRTEIPRQRDKPPGEQASYSCTLQPATMHIATQLLVQVPDTLARRQRLLLTN
jgi:hypothetical protein